MSNNEKPTLVSAIKKSNLLKDGMPSFYVCITDHTCCTHRMSDTDIPVWCRSTDDTMKLMDILNQCD